MPAAQPKKKPGGLVYAKSLLVATPPGILGFSALITPDQFEEEDKPQFKAKWHHTEKALARWAELVHANALSGKLLEKLREEPGMSLGKAQGADTVDAEEYLGKKAKQPSESDRVQLPFIQFHRSSTYKNRDGEEVQARVKAWDAKNTLLDMKSLRLGVGSEVQIVVTPGVFCGAFSDWMIAPCFRLEGIRVLKLEQYGAGGGQLGELTEEDRALMEDDSQLDNLSQYAMTDKAPTPAAQPAFEKTELEDDIPF